METEKGRKQMGLGSLIDMQITLAGDVVEPANLLSP
jgi:hypothetical protein